MKEIPINITVTESKPQLLFIYTNSPYCLINDSMNTTLTITHTLTIINITVWVPANYSLGQKTWCKIYYKFPNLPESHGGGGGGGSGGGGGYYPPSNETPQVPTNETQTPSETPSNQTPPSQESHQEPANIPSKKEILTRVLLIFLLALIILWIVSFILLRKYRKKSLKETEGLNKVDRPVKLKVIKR